MGEQGSSRSIEHGMRKGGDTMDAMERVTTRQAAKELKIDVEALQYLMRKKELSIGYVLKKEVKARCTYYIYRGLLEEEKRRLQGGNIGRA